MVEIIYFNNIQLKEVVNMRKIIYILIIIGLFLFSCVHHKQVKVDRCPDSSLDSIFVSYFNYDYIDDFPINYKNKYDILLNKHRPTFKKEYYGTKGKYTIDYEGVIDTFITDCSVLSQIENARTLSIRNDMFNNSVRVRMGAIFVYDNRARDTLLFDGDYHLYLCKNEGFWLNRTEDLTYIIKKNTGYYSWFNKYKKNDRDSDFSYFSELDTLNRRDSIKVWLENNPKVQGATLDYW